MQESCARAGNANLSQIAIDAPAAVEHFLILFLRPAPGVAISPQSSVREWLGRCVTSRRRLQHRHDEPPSASAASELPMAQTDQDPPLGLL